jgi:hypothetical protein
MRLMIFSLFEKVNSDMLSDFLLEPSEYLSHSGNNGLGKISVVGQNLPNSGYLRQRVSVFFNNNRFDPAITVAGEFFSVQPVPAQPRPRSGISVQEDRQLSGFRAGPPTCPRVVLFRSGYPAPFQTGWRSSLTSAPSRTGPVPVSVADAHGPDQGKNPLQDIFSRKPVSGSQHRRPVLQ